ncbi:helix-turn-helix transcriptional regulator [Nonomuraea longicatena]|uniref:HTH luxR-type domain-containing protein n=1 Tax=Nonomuraea longicatena TaxID=83682 RepID=A0ABN1QEF3_9ACTN
MADISLLQAFAEVGYQVAGTGGAHGAMAALGRVVPVDGYEFVAFDPATGRHRSVVSAGHERIDGDAAQEYTGLDSYRRALSTRAPVAMPEPGTRRYFRRHLAPYGWRHGLTAPLFLPEGRYTGLIHLAYRDSLPEAAGPLLTAAAPMLAHVTDLSRCLVSPTALPPGYRALAFDRAGVRREVPGVEPSEALRDEPAVAAFARDFIDSRELGRHGLWKDRRGRWHDVRAVRAGVGYQSGLQGAVIAERPCALPYELTGREVDVLTRVAAGDSNPQIAAALVLSVRTVTTHLEHIFAKLGCDSRTRLTTKALAEGLCRLDL